MNELEKIVEEEAARVTKSLSRRMVDAIFDNRDFRTVKRHLVRDEILPWIGNKVREVADRMIFELFYPNKDYSSRPSGSNTNYTSYSSNAMPGRGNRYGVTTRQPTTTVMTKKDQDAGIRSNLGPFDFREVAWATQELAQDKRDAVIHTWDDQHADSLSVCGLYSVWDISTSDYNTTAYGWVNRNDLLRGVVKRRRDGYWYIDYPNPIEFID